MLWLFILSLWIVSLFLFCELVIRDRGTVIFKILIMTAGSLLGIFSIYFLFIQSPQIKSLRLRADQLQTFCEAIRKAARTHALQEILDSAVKIIVDVTGVRGCSIKLLDVKSGRMRVRSISGIDSDKMDKAINLVENIYHKGLMNEEPIVVRDILMRDFPAVDDEIESLICVPLRLVERILGAICIFGRRGQRLSKEMISLLSSLGDVVSLAIARALVYEDLMSLVKTKTKFMLQASHELRSPLNTLQSIARTLLDGYLGELNEKQRDMISRIDIRAQMLSEIVNDLLILATGRAELSTLKPERLDLVRLIEESAGFYETRAKEKKIDLVINSVVEEATVIGNKEGLRSIATNLISNALKYTPEGGRITLKLFKKNDNIVFEIEDTGIGIPKDEKERLFGEFFRASNAKTLSESGTGLGLAIVKARVEQHGGSIEVESEEGKGTTFRIFLFSGGK